MKSFIQYIKEEYTLQKVWHGGNLTDAENTINHKKGRYEYGAGLYTTTHYDTAQKYAKGSRKLYLLTIKQGTNIDGVILDKEKAYNFINTHVIKNKRKEIIDRLETYPMVKANVFNNLIINLDGIKPSNTGELRKFLVDSGIDYMIVNNAFGWGELMVVVYNMNIIVDKKIITGKDKITEFDQPIILK
ncbi:MAG: hypothetical protein WC679_00925 [Bacteroidales bacterium]|jgi:hypothetical protein